MGEIRAVAISRTDVLRPIQSQCTPLKSLSIGSSGLGSAQSKARDVMYNATFFSFSFGLLQEHRATVM